jgi:general secretion pathway protein B
MSYILEALKKAEQARLAAKLPDRQSLALSSDEPVRERLAWLYGAMLATVVVSASAAGWWFSSKSHEKPMPEKVATISPLSHIESEATREPVAKPGTRAAGAAALGRPHGDSGNDDAAPGVAPASTPEPAVAPLAGALQVTSSQTSAHSKPRDSVQQPDKSADAVGLPEPKHVARPASSVNPVSDQKSKPKRADKPVATAAVETIDLKHVDLKPSRGSRVLHLEELPPEVRRDVPKLSATGYVYSADTGVRVVNVNERSLQEGDELTAGLKLEQIAPDHVLFSFRGYRFRVEMF